MPPELKERPNWVLWVPIWSGSKWTKRPLQISGYGASTTNPKHWSTFDQARQAYDRAVQQGGIEIRQKGKPVQRVPIGGVGFVFDGQPDSDGLVLAGVDFDKVISGGQITSLATERIKRLGSYCERSVSGSGLHVIVKAKPLASGVAHSGVEMYTTGRYFTMTGAAPANANIIAAPEAFAALAEELLAEKAASQADGTNPADECAAQDDPADAGADTWFGKLSPEQQSEAVEHATMQIATNSKMFELSKHGGHYQDYLRLAFAIARSGVQGAEDIFVKAASAAKDADPDDTLRKFFLTCASADPHANGVTVGTLLHLSQQYGANFDKWKRQVSSSPWLPPEQRTPLRGGVYSENEALELINSHYFIGKDEKQIGIFRINDDGTIAFTLPDQLKLDLDNILVRRGDKLVKGDKFWREDPRRRQCKIVFKLGRNADPGEYNLWRGFAIEPRMGWDKQYRLVQHIREVVCRCDHAKFKYLMRWLAFLVQHPDELPGAVIVLKSRAEGTGKSTVGAVMLKIFGPHHSALVDDKDRIVGRFNDWLEPMCFVLAEEILWAGDRRSTDKLKSRITAPQMPMERKNGAVWQADNHLHVIMTTNHDHAVAAGVGDRRYVVFDVDDRHANDKSWFGPLYQDLNDGGASEFLWLLKNLRLGDWHPRQIIKTAEAKEQQRMSADSVSEWAQACIYADAIVGLAGILDLGKRIPSDDLRQAYTGFCKQHGLRAVSGQNFGTACTQMFGPRARASAPNSAGKRPWGYDVPDGPSWQQQLDARLGVK